MDAEVLKGEEGHDVSNGSGEKYVHIYGERGRDKADAEKG